MSAAKVILLAVHMRDGREWLIDHRVSPSNGFPFLIVTPRSERRLRGAAAVAVIQTPGFQRLAQAERADCEMGASIAMMATPRS